MTASVPMDRKKPGAPARIPPLAWLAAGVALLAGFVIAASLGAEVEPERYLVLNGKARATPSTLEVEVRYDFQGEPGDHLLIRIALAGTPANESSVQGVATEDGAASGMRVATFEVRSGPRAFEWIAQGKVDGSDTILHEITGSASAPSPTPPPS